MHTHMFSGGFICTHTHIAAAATAAAVLFPFHFISFILMPFSFLFSFNRWLSLSLCSLAINALNLPETVIVLLRNSLSFSTHIIDNSCENRTNIFTTHSNSDMIVYERQCNFGNNKMMLHTKQAQRAKTKKKTASEALRRKPLALVAFCFILFARHDMSLHCCCWWFWTELQLVEAGVLLDAGRLFLHI